MKIDSNENFEFLRNNINEVEEHIKGFPTRINNLSMYVMGCEWCDNETLCLAFGFEKTDINAPHHTKGFPNSGMWHIFKDKTWHRQSEWFVCGKCEKS